ncbi:MAG TPA: CAP domain-containing protein [Candidatus Binataceae bacterium]|nr:CAP domain-containing protein [Candidatus Binataceae bacterium]
MPTPEIVRRSQRKRLLGLMAITTVLAIVAAREYFANTEAGGTIIRPRLQPNAVETRLLQLVNAARENAGENALIFSRPLMAAAYFHSADMANADYLGYDGPAGDTPVDRVISRGIDYREIAENLCRRDADRLSNLADHALAQWLANPHDRSDLLAPQLRTTAIAISRASDGSFYITQDFAR